MLPKFKKILVYIFFTIIGGHTTCSRFSLFSEKLSQLNRRHQSIYLYTQTNAHRSIPIIDQRIKELFATPLSPYPNALSHYAHLIQNIIAKEEQYKYTHYVFYHAEDPRVRILQDFNSELCILRGLCTETKSYIPLRTFGPKYFGLPNINSWMDSKAHYLTNVTKQFNNQPDVQPFLLAANMALFANVARMGSNTFSFFLAGFSAKAPYELILNEILEPIISNNTKRNLVVNSLLPKLSQLTTLLSEKRGNLIQIFIPKNLVNDLVYLSRQQGYYWSYRIPGISSLDTVWDDTKKRYTAISPLLEIYQKTPEKLAINLYGNPKAKDIIDSASIGIYQLIIDRIEARIFLRGELFGKPNKLIKMFNYWPLDPSKETMYKNKLKQLAQEALAAVST